jgi:hypothetical protein
MELCGLHLRYQYHHHDNDNHHNDDNNNPRTTSSDNQFPWWPKHGRTTSLLTSDAHASVS